MEIKSKNKHFPVIIAVSQIPELQCIDYAEDGIRFGASVTLSNVDKVLQDSTKIFPGTRVLFSFTHSYIIEVRHNFIVVVYRIFSS